MQLYFLGEDLYLEEEAIRRDPRRVVAIVEKWRGNFYLAQDPEMRRVWRWWVELTAPPEVAP